MTKRQSKILWVTLLVVTVVILALGISRVLASSPTPSPAPTPTSPTTVPNVGAFAELTRLWDALTPTTQRAVCDVHESDPAQSRLLFASSNPEISDLVYQTFMETVC